MLVRGGTVGEGAFGSRRSPSPGRTVACRPASPTSSTTALPGLAGRFPQPGVSDPGLQIFDSYRSRFRLAAAARASFKGCFRLISCHLPQVREHHLGEVEDSTQIVDSYRSRFRFAEYP